MNRSLPSWMTLGGEYRLRAEGTRGPAKVPAGTHDFLTQRSRLSLKVRATPWLQLFAEGQDARNWGLPRANLTGSIRDTFDLRQGYALIGKEGGWWTVKAGRQVLGYATERLIGGSNWTNAARAFDAVKLTLRHNQDWVDVFASSVVVNSLDDLDHHQQGNNLHGIYGSVASLIPNARVEPYVLLRTNHTAKMHDWTGGVRSIGTLAKLWTYDLDFLKQNGFTGKQNLSAWATSLTLTRALPVLPWNASLIGEYNYSSGDKNPHDNVSNTLDQLYPTNHGIYGWLDMVGRRNSENIMVRYSFKPAKWLTLQVSGHSFWLSSKYDALYTTPGTAAVPAVAGGAISRDVGREIDFGATIAKSKYWEIAQQYGHFFPGKYLQTYAPGQRDFYAVWIGFKL